MRKKAVNFIMCAGGFILVIILLYFIIQRNVSGESYTNLFGYTILEVMTGSMSGTIEIGDGVIVELTTDVENGDIVVYKKDNYLITHRLIEKNDNTLITKGDANNTQDDPINRNEIVGKVIYKIPHLNIWKKGILYGLCIVIMVVIIVRQIGKIRDKKEREKE